jgi:hypothetical protein
MLMHGLFQEQVLRERARDHVTPIRRRAGDDHEPRVPSLLRTMIPAFTHGLVGIPAPPRAAGGC